MTPEDRSRAAQMIHKIYEAWDGFPSEIFIEGVTYRDRDPSFGGGYADVYRARYKDKPVALKRLRVFIQGEEPRAIRSKFRREVLVWQRLKHPYILPLIGIFREETSWSSLFMVSPWMDRGNILGHLRDIGMNDVNRRLYEIAQGIQYLHSQGVVHGDLRGQNIVVTENWNACLIDFGLSRYSEASRRSSKDGGSTRWMAPELIDPEHFEVEFLATYASDVYAFGCVCMELYTLQPPFIKIPLEASDYAILLRVIEGERPERPTEEPLMTDSFWNCVTTYWGQDRATRPSAADIVLDMASFCSVGVGHRKNSAVPLIQPGTSDSPFWFSIDDTSDTDDFLPLSLDHADIISLSPDGTIVQPRTGVQRACSRGCVYPY
ncbi:kinase-like domain-containing protein [Mycena epipterygia]|nr:kinase-like domain-containing protein [Mycena epipterygia]